MRPGVLLRLIICLAMLHGGGHAFSEEVDNGEGDSVEPVEPRVEGIERAAGNVVGGHDEEGGGRGPGTLVGSVGKAVEPVDGRAGEGADGAGGVFGIVGECVGKRFKKCR